MSPCFFGETYLVLSKISLSEFDRPGGKETFKLLLVINTLNFKLKKKNLQLMNERIVLLILMIN